MVNNSSYALGFSIILILSISSFPKIAHRWSQLVTSQYVGIAKYLFTSCSIYNFCSKYLSIWWDFGERSKPLCI